jgi:hypothetical protein
MLFILDFWIRLFGVSSVSIAVLDAFAIGAVLLLVDSIGRRVAPAPIHLSALAIVSAAYLLGAFKSMLFQTETLGLVLLLAAVRILMVRHKRGWYFAVAGGLTLLSTQMKDIYLPALVGLLLLVLMASSTDHRKRLEQTAEFALGAFLACLAVVGYLVSLGALGAYAKVLQYKIERFGIPLWLLVVVVLSIGVLYVASRAFDYRLTEMPRRFYYELLGVVTFLSVLAGTIWQGRIPLGHYGEPVFVMFVVMLTCMSKFLSARKETVFSRVVGVSILLMIMAAPVVLDFLGRGHAPRLTEPEQVMAVFAPESRDAVRQYSLVSKASSTADCVMQPFGWDAGATYVYAERRPCTRFFLPNLMTASQKDEYVAELLADPPVAVLYSPQGADLDVEQFQNSVFNWRLVLDNCYRLLEGDGRWAAFASDQGEGLQDCVRRFGV